MLEWEATIVVPGAVRGFIEVVLGQCGGGGASDRIKSSR